MQHDCFVVDNSALSYYSFICVNTELLQTLIYIRNLLYNLYKRKTAYPFIFVLNTIYLFIRKISLPVFGWLVFYIHAWSSKRLTAGNLVDRRRLLSLAPYRQVWSVCRHANAWSPFAVSSSLVGRHVNAWSPVAVSSRLVGRSPCRHVCFFAGVSCTGHGQSRWCALLAIDEHYGAGGLCVCMCYVSMCIMLIEYNYY